MTAEPTASWRSAGSEAANVDLSAPLLLCRHPTTGLSTSDSVRRAAEARTCARSAAGRDAMPMHSDDAPGSGVVPV